MDVFSLVAKLTLDSSEYNRELNEAKSGLSRVGDFIKGGLATAAKVGTAAVTVASGAVVGLTKSAVDGFAEYEQLVGGVETLFGESAQKVIDDASNAFRTAGMSMNDYMETSIQSAASLINALDGDQAKAADLMNMSITDMADNVNKMGTTMEAVQNAYRGFSRGNFTMLDNLALGFAGTKEGMQELLDKAEEISGVKFDISSYADIVEAIHVVQDEMGITGTTTKEASETISGSVASMKAAWTNLVAGIADENANFDKLIEDFVNSARTALGNILPTVKEVLNGVGVLIEGLAPVITEALPQLIQGTLPSLVKAAVSIIQSIVDVFSDDNSINMIVQAAIDVVLTLADALVNNVDKIIDAVVTIIVTIAEVLTDPENLERIIEAAVKIVLAVSVGILKAIPDLLVALGKVLVNILYTIGEWKNDLIEAGEGLVKSIADGVAQKVEDAKNWGRDLLDNFISGIREKFGALRDTVSNAAEMVKDFLGFSEPKEGPLSNFHTYAPDMMKLFAQGIRDNESLVADQIARSFDFGARTVDFVPSVGGANGFGGNSLGYENNREQSTPINITLTLDGATLARVMYDYNKRESDLRGAAFA